VVFDPAKSGVELGPLVLPRRQCAFWTQAPAIASPTFTGLGPWRPTREPLDLALALVLCTVPLHIWVDQRPLVLSYCAW